MDMMSLKLWACSLLLFFICQPVVLKGYPAPSFDLYFTEETTRNFVIHHGLAVSNAFTVCYRVRTTETTINRVVFSYATSSEGNELTLFTQPDKMRVYIGGDSRDFSFTATEDGKWHHICVSWENGRGDIKLYRDGVLQAYGHSLNRGHVINSRGTLVIGQDQDNVGGSFEAQQCFIGELTDLNVWNRVVSAAEIRSISGSCHGSSGNVKKWTDFRAGIRGSVKVLSPSACGQ